MKIFIANESSQKLGGGFSFIDYLIRGVGEGMIAPNLESSDIVLIPSPSMITKEYFMKLKEGGKKIVLRLDNALKNSRNRNTGSSRMMKYATESDYVIYQSQWAYDYLYPWLKAEGTVIHNAVDEKIFNANGRASDFGQDKDVYLYSRFNRDETKSWHVAWYKYQMIQRANPNALLVIVGQFSPEDIEYGFDFFMGERVHYYGVASDHESMARIYKSCNKLIAPYYNDCFSNTYIEALMCGVELHEPDMSGGTPEIISMWNEKGREYFSLDRMVTQYLGTLREVLDGVRV